MFNERIEIFIQLGIKYDPTYDALPTSIIIVCPFVSMISLLIITGFLACL